mmetsp:Transcript_49496/g.124154  ORF Transcript_49496/g.124154 Transcript_49496/m.124154 type:complete len:96 (-) Transcript_49496:50-337(-)
MQADTHAHKGAHESHHIRWYAEVGDDSLYAIQSIHMLRPSGGHDGQKEPPLTSRTDRGTQHTTHNTRHTIDNQTDRQPDERAATLPSPTHPDRQE